MQEELFPIQIRRNCFLYMTPMDVSSDGRLCNSCGCKESEETSMTGLMSLFTTVLQREQSEIEAYNAHI